MDGDGAATLRVHRVIVVRSCSMKAITIQLSLHIIAPSHMFSNMMTFGHLRSRLLLLVCCFPAVAVQAHARFKCPSPRSADTGIKTGPCGDQTNDFSLSSDGAAILEIAPGPMRIELEESISHTGAPFRIALSSDGSDDDGVCVLLDHIPHNDNPASRPQYLDESTYTPYSITIEIPDVYCEKCSLHMANPMTDKIDGDGAPDAPGCTDPDGTCFSVYHSCTVPFKITGSVPRSQFTCPASPLPDDWPLQWIGDDGVPVAASTPGVYRRERSEWSADGLLLAVPEFYRQDVGVCSSTFQSEAASSPVEGEEVITTVPTSAVPLSGDTPTSNNGLTNAIPSAATGG
jgi:hypothetical protein